MGARGIIIAAIIFLSSSAEGAMVRYTAPPGMAGLNSPDPESTGYYYSQTSVGAFHSLMKKIFEGTDAEPLYVPAESYNAAVQLAMLYGKIPESRGADMAVGAAFDEDTLKYLDYIAFPIYEDFLTIILDKGGPEFKHTKELDTTIAALMPARQPEAVMGLKAGVPDGAESAEKTADAFEALFSGRRFLVIPWAFASGYFNLNPDNPRVKTLQVLKYQKRRVPYFIAVARDAAMRPVSKGSAASPMAEFIERRLAELAASGELKEIFAPK